MKTSGDHDAAIREEWRCLCSVDERSKLGCALVGGVAGDVDLLDREAAVSVPDQLVDECHDRVAHERRIVAAEERDGSLFGLRHRSRRLEDRRQHRADATSRSDIMRT